MHERIALFIAISKRLLSPLALKDLPKMTNNSRLAAHWAGSMVFIQRRSAAATFLVVASLSFLALPASADSPALLGYSVPDCVPDCIRKWCRDDYCRKSEPCVCVPLNFTCDDYCCKKEPRVCAPLCFGCDDYRKKCLPKVCSSPLLGFLRCGPSPQQCSCGKCDGQSGNHVNAARPKPAERTDRIAGQADAERNASEPMGKTPASLPHVTIGRVPFGLID